MLAPQSSNVDATLQAAVSQAAALVVAWAGVPTKVELQSSESRRVFKVTSPKRPGEVLCVRLLESCQDGRLVQWLQGLGAANLGPPVLAASSTAVVQPWLDRGSLDPTACREPVAAARLGRFVASLHRLPIEGPVAPKARAEDLVSCAQNLTTRGVMSISDAEQFVSELQQISAVLQNVLNGDGAHARAQLVWTHGNLSLKSLVEERWPADLASLYEGTVSHPALGQGVVFNVCLESGTRGRWQALGESQDIFVSIAEGQIVLRDAAGRMRLTGIASGLGCIRGEVEHNGITGGSFVLFAMSEAAMQPQLKAVDLEMAGRRPAVTDVSSFFLSWALADGLQYPTLDTRRSFASAYLATMGHPADITAVDTFLWAVECESMLQAAWLGLTAAGKQAGPQKPSSALALQLLPRLPVARSVLASAIGNATLRAAILDRGVFWVQ